MRAIAATVACASLFIWVAALPPFQIGLWYLSESVEVALFGIGALAALALALHPQAIAAAQHPLVLIPLALAALTLAMSAFVPFPARSWFGSPQTGEGGFWWLSLGLLVALMRLVDVAALTHAACWSAAAMLGLTLIGQPLNSFPDYLAFVGLALVIVDRSWPSLAAATFLIALSGSKGAMLLCPLVIGMALLRFPRVPLTLGAPVVAVCGILAMSDMPSAWSRIMLWACSAQALLTEAGIWWHGFGWGGVNDMMMRHRDLYLGMLRPGYGPNGADWHSHNEFIEAWLSVGLLGPALLVALFVCAVWNEPSRLRIGALAAYAGLSAIWMPLPHVVPFLALALAVTAGRVE